MALLKLKINLVISFYDFKYNFFSNNLIQLKIVDAKCEYFKKFWPNYYA